jgi:hypothetical protein
MAQESRKVLEKFAVGSTELKKGGLIRLTYFMDFEDDDIIEFVVDAIKVIIKDPDRIALPVIKIQHDKKYIAIGTDISPITGTTERYDENTDRYTRRPLGVDYVPYKEAKRDAGNPY